MCAVAPAFSAQPARPPRWPAQPVITIRVDAPTAPPGAGALVERALATGTRAADGRLVLQTTESEDDALVRVRFAQAGGIDGEAAPRLDRATGAISSAAVLIARDVAGDALQPQIVIYLTALHELGYVLGLPHTGAFDDIMYSFPPARRWGAVSRACRRRLRSSDDM